MSESPNDSAARAVCMMPVHSTGHLVYEEWVPAIGGAGEEAAPRGKMDLGPTIFRKI